MIRRPPRRRSIARSTLLTLLALAVLLAQSAGLLHRIQHARGGAPISSLAATASTADAADAARLGAESQPGPAPASSHDCAAFDAAALNDAPPLAVSLTSVAPSDATAFAAPTRVVVASAPAVGYLSRAPPRA